jgi:hypothetical protein
MDKIKEKRDILIDNKVFTKDDIISLTKIFIKSSDEILVVSKEIARKELIHDGWDESRIKESDTDKGYSQLELSSDDNIHYSFTINDLADMNDILASKRIIELNFQFWERALNSRFTVIIKQTDARSSSGSSYAEIKGDDLIWVDQTQRVTEDFFATCRNQSNFLRKYSFIIIPLTVLIFNLFLNNVIELVSSRMHLFHKWVMTSLTSDWGFVIIVLTLFTALPVVFIYNRIVKLWPRIELQTGNDYQKIGSRKRNKLLIVVSIIIIPAVISFLLRIF